MVIRKITIDNSVKFVKKSNSQSEQTRESKPNLIKIKSIPRKQNEQTQYIPKGAKINIR